MERDYLEQLNEQQRAAVVYTSGPSLVIAGAGSGKTRVLTYKIAHLLNLGYTPYRIMALTFTNKAAREMRERIERLVGTGEAAQLWMGTFHSIFARILRINAERIGFRRDYTIYDTADSRSLIKVIIRDMKLDEKVYNPTSVQSHISNVKNSLISPLDYREDNELMRQDSLRKQPETYAIYKAYWNRCFIAGAMDFDDLLFYTNILFRDNPDVLAQYQERFSYVLVDEYQDTNFAQHLILTQLCAVKKAICMVGDDAQSIYSFRGANINNILGLEKSYPGLKTFKLERNYRSTQSITQAANSLISKNRYQIRKEIYSTNSRGEKIQLTKAFSDYEEGYLVANHIIATKSRQGGAYSDFAVLYRTNAQSRILEEALRKRDIPYAIYGGLSFYKRKEIKDAICYFRLAINPNDDEALRRVINYPARGIGETTLSKLQQAAMGAGVSLWSVMNDTGGYNVAVNAGTKRKIEAFVNLITSFVEANRQGMTAYDLAKKIIAETRLISVLQGDTTPENVSKVENLGELLNGVKDFYGQGSEQGSGNVMLTDFLAVASLATDEDDEDDGSPKVSLMTVHSAKGLEFKNVVIVGVEEDLFPSALSKESIYGIEEERRLLYVAITRAQVTCQMTYAASRYRNGETRKCNLSRFVSDIDPKYINVTARTGGVSSTGFSPSRFQWSGFSAFPAEDLPQPSRDWAQGVELGTRRQGAKPEAAQLAQPVGTAGKQDKANGGEDDYAIHTASDIAVGSVIEHSRFGSGTVTVVDTTGLDAKITVDFAQVGRKVLVLKFARFKVISR